MPGRCVHFLPVISVDNVCICGRVYRRPRATRPRPTLAQPRQHVTVPVLRITQRRLWLQPSPQRSGSKARKSKTRGRRRRYGTSIFDQLYPLRLCASVAGELCSSDSGSKCTGAATRHSSSTTGGCEPRLLRSAASTCTWRRSEFRCRGCACLPVYCSYIRSL